MNRILSLLFNLNSNIRKSYERDKRFVRVLYQDRERQMLEDQLEEYYFVTYKNYDRLRILMIKLDIMADIMSFMAWHDTHMITR